MFLNKVTFFAIVSCILSTSLFAQTADTGSLGIPNNLLSQVNSMNTRPSSNQGLSGATTQQQLRSILDQNNRSAPIKKTNREKAFEKLQKSMFPLHPKEIQILRNQYNQLERAKVYTSAQPPRPTSSSIIVDLAPGATPPVIRLSSGFVSSLIFLDATGAPWPIKAYDIGDPEAFQLSGNLRPT